MPFTKHAMEGIQGGTTFFATSMSWGELEQMAVFPEELAAQLDDEEDSRLQRGLARSRLAPLIHYLTEVPDHFFSALTLILLPRDLGRAAAEPLGSLSPDWDYSFERGIQAGPGRQVAGVLHLSGDVRLFPADGQHRLRAAVDALRVQPALAREEVPVVLIPYKNRDQVRQLFSDLNLNAKPVNKTVGYALDSRDPIALLAKRVGVEIQLFNGRVNRTSNSLPRSSANVITLNTLVECSRILASAWLGIQDAGKLAITVSADQSKAAEHAREAWDGILDPFAEHWGPVIAGDSGAAGKLREAYVFPHGLGWTALATVAGESFRSNPRHWRKAFKLAAGSVDWSRNNPNWEGVATLRGSVNNTAPAVKATAQLLMSRNR